MDGPWRLRVVSLDHGGANIDIGYCCEEFRDERANSAEIYYHSKFWRVERYYQE